MRSVFERKRTETNVGQEEDPMGRVEKDDFSKGSFLFPTTMYGLTMSSMKLPTLPYPLPLMTIE